MEGFLSLLMGEENELGARPRFPDSNIKQPRRHAAISRIPYRRMIRALVDTYAEK